MKSTLFLKGVVVLIGIAALALCLLRLPGIASRDAAAHPETAYLQYPFLVCAYLLFTLFFIALYQSFQLLNDMDRNRAFSASSVKALRVIKYCAIMISILFAAGILFVILCLEGDRAGIFTLGFLCTFASSVIATFAAVLQKLLQDAVELKSENDLTV